MHRVQKLPSSSPLEPGRRVRLPRLLGVILAVIILVLAVLGFVIPGPSATDCPPSPEFLWVAGDRGHTLTYWSVTIRSFPHGHLPAATYLHITSGSPPHLDLSWTPWSALTRTNWNTTHVLYEDNNPSAPEICIGDRLVIDIYRYPAGGFAGVSRRGWPPYEFFGGFSFGL